jgi:hypothetical protein
MTAKNNAAGRDDTAANKTATENHNPKTRIAMLCPCCGGEVTHHRYGFDVITAAPFRITTWLVCDDCEGALTGNDPAARENAQAAMLKYLEDHGHATPA